MRTPLRLTVIALSVGLTMVVGAWLYWSWWRSNKIFTECHTTNLDTPIEYEIFSECMKSYSLDPEDWEEPPSPH